MLINLITYCINLLREIEKVSYENNPWQTYVVSNVKGKKHAHDSDIDNAKVSHTKPIVSITLCKLTK